MSAPRYKLCGRKMNLVDGKYRCGHGWSTPQTARKQREADMNYRALNPDR